MLSEKQRIIAVGGIWGMSLMAYITFLVAYANQNSQVTIDVNMFGEKHWELAVLTLIFGAGTIALAELSRDYAQLHPKISQ